jgi:hypothetical protein
MVFLQDDIQNGMKARQRQKIARTIAIRTVMIVLDVSARV